MIQLSLAQIAQACSGTLHGDDAIVTGNVVTDSREVTPGGLYVARVGEHADGHDYAAAAAAAGAVGCLGERPVPELPTIVVEDVQLAFAKLGRRVTDGIDGLEIVGITGSSGKTSTKDMLGAVLSSFAPTISPVGSLNSEIGVPLTVCRLDANSKYLVAEMGADGVGHIAYLAKIAPPKVGIVLNVGKAHLGEFGSVDAIAQTKGELVEALPSDGVAILNADDERVAAMAPRTAARVITVGVRNEADFRATNVHLDGAGRASYHLISPLGEADVRLAMFGEHQVGNSLSVIAAATALGHPLDAVVAAVGEAKAASRWRMEVHELGGGVTLINDAYNANPDSMRAALRSLAAMGVERHTVAVLGQMLELGDGSHEEHRAVGLLAAELGIREVVTVGEGARGIAEGALAGGMTESAVYHVADTEAAHQLLTKLVKPGHILILKSSRDSGLRLLGDQLVDEAGTTAFPATEELS